MHFLFEHPIECNLILVHEFYVNQDPRQRDLEVEIRSKVVTFTANTLNVLIGMAEVNAEPLKLIKVEPPYAHIRHSLYGTHSTSRWEHHKENNTHVSLSFTHINREARLWAKIIYDCLVHKMHLTEVTHYRVCLIYDPMHYDVDVNVGVVIFSGLRKSRLQGTCQYGFGGLLTQFLWEHGVEEEDIDYKLAVNTRPLDLCCTKGSAPYGGTMTILERQDQNDEITSRMYRLQILQLQISGCPAIQQEI